MRFSIENICRCLLFLWLGFSLQSCENDAESPYPAIEFKAEASMPGTGRSSAVGFAINGKGYVALGKKNLNDNYLNDCWEYSPDSNKWTRKKDFPGVARVKAIAQVVNGKAYIGLGYAGGGVYESSSFYLHDFWRYDPSIDQWDSVSRFPSNSTDACVSFVYKNNIYVGSGFDGYGFQIDFWKYNPLDNLWTRLANFPGSSRSGATICSNGERVFFGTGFMTYCTNDWWEYFPESDSWKQVRKMSDARVNAIGLSVNNRFFVSTGRFFAGNLTGGHVKSDILEYDAARNVWYQRGNIPNGNRENAISFTINGKGYIGFGENDETVLNDLWSFEP